MALITLVRHGQASWGTENYDRLSPKGIEQSKFLGQIFSDQKRNFDQVWVGDMLRHHQTAKYCLETMGASYVPLSHKGLNEFDHEHVLFAHHKGRYATKNEMIQAIKHSAHPVKSLGGMFKDAVHRWQSGNFDTDYPETWSNFQSRCNQVFMDIANGAKGKNVLVFSSGGAISVIVQSLLGLSNKATFELNWAMVNCSVTQILSSSDRQTVLSINEHQYFREQNMDLLTWH